MRRFGMQRSKAYQRLGVLVDAGFVRHEQGVRSPRVYIATSAGLAAAELDLPRGTVSAASCAHDLALVDVAIPMELTPGLRVLTERELRRSGEGPDGRNRFRLGSLGADESARGHWPDLVELDPTRQTVTAIEVELTFKKAERIQEKLRAYSIAEFDRVRYVCTNLAVAKAVDHAARRAGIEHKVAIENPVDVKVVGPNEMTGVVSKLEQTLRQERVLLAAANQRAAIAERSAESERRAGFLLIDQIASYLESDRVTQRHTRESWSQMVGARTTAVGTLDLET